MNTIVGQPVGELSGDGGWSGGPLPPPSVGQRGSESPSNGTPVGELAADVLNPSVEVVPTS